MTKGVLEPKFKKELKKLAPELDEEEFVREAVEEKILSLKKERFLKLSSKLKTALKKSGYSKEDVLRDFDKFYHQS